MITKVGTINTIPSPVSDWTNTVKHINAFINQVNNQAFILSDPLGTTQPTIKQGCYINHGGTLYIVDTEDYTPSGSPADGNVYIKLTPSGDTLVGSFITDISSYSFNQQYGNMVSGDDMILPYLLVKSGTSWTKYRYQPMNASFNKINVESINTGYGNYEVYKHSHESLSASGNPPSVTIGEMDLYETRMIYAILTSTVDYEIWGRVKSPLLPSNAKYYSMYIATEWDHPQFGEANLKADVSANSILCEGVIYNKETIKIIAIIKRIL